MVKHMASTYLIIVCNKNRTISAEAVADVLRFGTNEKPEAATRRLTHFVNEELPAVEAAALEAPRELRELFAAIEPLKNDKNCRGCPPCMLESDLMIIRMLTSTDACDAPLFLIGRRPFWQRLYDCFYCLPTEPGYTLEHNRMRRSRLA